MNPFTLILLLRYRDLTINIFLLFCFLGKWWLTTIPTPRWSEEYATNIPMFYRFDELFTQPLKSLSTCLRIVYWVCTVRNHKYDRLKFKYKCFLVYTYKYHRNKYKQFLTVSSFTVSCPLIFLFDTIDWWRTVNFPYLITKHVVEPT